MLEFRKTSITLGDFGLTADFTLEQGARVAVMGPSGAGKSTLLSLVSGFQIPDTGKVVWQGLDMTDTPPGQRPVSMLFQDQNLFAHLTAQQNVGLGVRPDLRLSRDEKDRVAAAMKEVGLDGLGPRKPAQMSGGQQSRVALARVLLRARPILLLDEPFGALGPALKADMLTLLARIAAETRATVLMVTHDPQDARLFAEQTVVVSAGMAHPPAVTRPLLDNPPPALRDYLGKA